MQINFHSDRNTIHYVMIFHMHLYYLGLIFTFFYCMTINIWTVRRKNKTFSLGLVTFLNTICKLKGISLIFPLKIYVLIFCLHFIISKLPKQFLGLTVIAIQIKIYYSCFLKKLHQKIFRSLWNYKQTDTQFIPFSSISILV